CPTRPTHPRGLPPETNPGFSSNHASGSACGWHSTSMVGSSRGSLDAAQTRPAVHTDAHTTPRGWHTPRPSVSAISSPHPPAAIVDVFSPVASANAAVTVEIGSVALTTSGSIDSGTATAGGTPGD